MIAIAALAATLVVMLAFWLVTEQVPFLRPYRDDLWHRHGGTVLLYTAMLGLNAFAGALLLARKLGLRRAGAKLRHLERDKTLEQQINDLTPPQD
jgi:hypothetical protein